MGLATILTILAALGLVLALAAVPQAFLIGRSSGQLRGLTARVERLERTGGS